METPKKYSDGPLIIPATEPGQFDTFIAPPLPEVLRAPHVGDIVDYWPSPRAALGPQGNLQVSDATQPLQARIQTVFGVRLLNVQVTDQAGTVRHIMSVPLVHDGDPDPDALTGRCTWPAVA